MQNILKADTCAGRWFDGTLIGCILASIDVLKDVLHNSLRVVIARLHYQAFGAIDVLALLPSCIAPLAIPVRSGPSAYPDMRGNAQGNTQVHT